MPVILDAADWQTWLGEMPASSDALQTLLRPFPAELSSTPLRSRAVTAPVSDVSAS
jgi:putative SOS response-associated peptidase YedK